MTSLRFQDPKPGAKIQVIGAGLPRTGTNSFCAALQILLKGPCYHAGVQWVARGAKDEKHAKTMIKAAGNFPWNEREKKNGIAEELEELLEGYVAVADPPLSLLYSELLEMYPDAKVIVTVRDPDSWATSMAEISRVVMPWYLGMVFFWLPSVRWLPEMLVALTNIFVQKFGIRITDKETCLATWREHLIQLEAIVPAKQLFYFNVKDGWEPLCDALGLPVPDVPFPRLNDAKDVEAHFQNLAIRGLARWAFFLVFCLFSICAVLLVVDGTISSIELVQSSDSTLMVVSSCLLSLLPVLLQFA